jgi:kumamolisin
MTTPQATGGGVSALFNTLPAWQLGVVSQVSINDNVSIGRGIPDVAGNASLNSGYMLTVDGMSVGP